MNRTNTPLSPTPDRDQTNTGIIPYCANGFRFYRTRCTKGQPNCRYMVRMSLDLVWTLLRDAPESSTCSLLYFHHRSQYLWKRSPRVTIGYLESNSELGANLLETGQNSLRILATPPSDAPSLSWRSIRSKGRQRPFAGLASSKSDHDDF
jgi:hypothetical protein